MKLASETGGRGGGGVVVGGGDFADCDKGEAGKGDLEGVDDKNLPAPVGGVVPVGSEICG